MKESVYLLTLADFEIGTDQDGREPYLQCGLCHKWGSITFNLASAATWAINHSKECTCFHSQEELADIAHAALRYIVTREVHGDMTPLEWSEESRKALQELVIACGPTTRVFV